jgi:hypothetical protein
MHRGRGPHAWGAFLADAPGRQVVGGRRGGNPSRMPDGKPVVGLRAGTGWRAGVGDRHA